MWHKQGKDTFKGPKDLPLNIEVQAISKTAKEAIENAGGKSVFLIFFRIEKLTKNE